MTDAEFQKAQCNKIDVKPHESKKVKINIPEIIRDGENLS